MIETIVIDDFSLGILVGVFLLWLFISVAYIIEKRRLEKGVSFDVYINRRIMKEERYSLKGKDEGFDLETAIKTFLVFKEWGHSTTLTDFLEFIKDQGIRIRKG